MYWSIYLFCIGGATNRGSAGFAHNHRYTFRDTLPISIENPQPHQCQPQTCTPTNRWLNAWCTNGPTNHKHFRRFFRSCRLIVWILQDFWETCKIPWYNSTLLTNSMNQHERANTGPLKRYGAKEVNKDDQ